MGDENMNPFFGPAGQQFDSGQAQLKRNEIAVLNQINQLRHYDVDQWLNLFADIFVAGMQDGIHAASGNREVHFSANPIMSVQVDDGNASTVEKHVFDNLIGYLNNPDSVEFATMDQVISEPILQRNQVVDWSELLDVTSVQLEIEDLFAIFLGGWQFGYQNFSFQFHHNHCDEATSYLKAQERAQRAIAYNHFDDATDQNTREYFVIRILNVMSDSMAHLAASR